MIFIEGLKYTKDHEWIKVEGSTVSVGITDFAQHSLGDVVFVELPEVGDEYSQGDSFSTIESVKAASDVYIPFTGKVIETNGELEDSPENINQEPYQSWIAKFKTDDISQINNLMDEIEYSRFCEEEE